MKTNSPPPSNGPAGKEVDTLLKAINRQMKTDKSAFKNSNYAPVSITLSVEDHADDLFDDPSQESEFMQGSVRGDTELTVLSSDEDDSMLDVLAAFPQPAFPLHQRVEVSLSETDTNHSYLLYVGVMLCCISSWSSRQVTSEEFVEGVNVDTLPVEHLPFLNYHAGLYIL